MRRCRGTPCATLAALVLVGACLPDGGRPDPDATTFARILEAEDARPTEGPVLDALIAGASAPDARTRRTAVRALGRLRRPTLIDPITSHVADNDPGVRAAAADALALALDGADGAAVLPLLLARARVERDDAARAALARALGRLALEGADRRRAAEALTSLAGAGDGLAPEAVLVGVALGFEGLLRRGSGDGLERAAADRLEAMANVRALDNGDDTTPARIRALAVSALGQARRLGLEGIERAQADPDPDVRRAPLRYLTAVAPSQRPPIVRRALDDPTPRVVIEALRLVAAGPRSSETCAWLMGAAGRDMPAAVRMVALEALGRPCPDTRAQVELLVEVASGLRDDDTGPWQPAAQALLSLSRVDRRRVAESLPRYVEHSSPFVRAYAAIIAGTVGAEETLELLARDPSPNVRGPALEALFGERGHRIDNLLLDQLAQDDPQLLITTARLLAASPGRLAVASALLVKLERLTAERRETSRDPRRALLERIGELGDASFADRVRPLLADFDSVVAADAAEVLRAWTGNAESPAPAPLPRAPLPPPVELQALERTSVALHMRGGGTIVIELLPDLAARNAWRFVSLARAGYFDGLTFHRWAPNFVLQGGSPGANEYAGDGPYTRDEVGGSHWRGTVGVSTRGRDTGDGQIFINLVDNVRLDPDYTVFGVVSEGMDVVDTLLEGALIERVELRVTR